MKKIGGWLSLLVSIIWCFLVIPFIVYLASGMIISTAYSFDSSASLIEYFLLVLTALGTVAIAVIVFKFGFDITVSSWKTARGIEPEPLNLMELSIKLKNKPNNTLKKDATDVAPLS